MKNLIKTIFLIFLATNLFAQDAKKEYTPAEKEQIQKSMDALKASGKKANEAAKTSDISAENARKALENYDKDVKINATVDKIESQTISRENQNTGVAVGPVPQPSAKENMIDFATSFFRTRPILSIFIIIFVLRVLYGVVQLFTGKD